MRADEAITMIKTREGRQAKLGREIEMNDFHTSNTFRAAQNCFSEFINGFAFNKIDMFDFHRISSAALGTLSKEMGRSDEVSENLMEKMHDAHELSAPGAARATLDGAGHGGASAARQGGARERRAPAPGGAARGA
jgi:hypothetical protein